MKFFDKMLLFLLLIDTIPHHQAYAAEDQALSAELKWLLAENVIEVVSKQKEDKNTSAGIVSVVKSKEIERYGAKNLLEVLSRVTSVYTIGNGLFADSVVSIRGDLFTAQSNHVLVLINGRPQRDSLTGAWNENIYRSFPLHQIEQIEVIRGPGSVMYGTNAYAGIINIVTKKDKENSAELHATYGSFNTGRVEAEGAWKNNDVAFTGGMRYSINDGWLFTAIGEDGKQGGFRANENDVSANFWLESHGFTLNGFLARNHHQHWGMNQQGFGQMMENEKVFVDLGYQKNWNTHWTTQTNFTYNHTGTRFNLPLFGAPPATLSSLAIDDLLFEQSHHLNFFDKKLNLLIGGLVEWQNGLGKTKRDTIIGAGIVKNYSQLRSNVYGEVSYLLLDSLKFNIGGQWNRVEQLNTGNIIQGKVGRLGLSYEFNKNTGAKVLYSQAFRNPDATEQYLNQAPFLVGNNQLRPERVETLDAQVYYQEKNYFLALTAFRSRQSNLITVIPTGNGFSRAFANAGSVVFKGLEFESEFKPLPTLQIQAAYTFQTNRAGDGKNNATPAPNHQFKAGISYEVLPQLQISLFDTFFSSAKKTNAAQINPPAHSYHNMTLNSRYQFGDWLGFTQAKQVSFSLYVDNLLNETIYYPELANIAMNTIPGKPGRSVYGELAIEF